MIRYVDFDGCLAHFDRWRGPEHYGDPVPEMVKKVKEWLSKGDKVVIHTARMTPGFEFGQRVGVGFTKQDIEQWCLCNIGAVLPVTNIKSYADVYYDDRCSKIIPNTGLTLEEKIATMAKDDSVSDSVKIKNILAFLKEVSSEV